MKNVLTILQIVLSVLLVFLIMVQPRGNKSFTRRGLEKLLYKLTYIVATLFLVNAVLMLVI